MITCPTVFVLGAGASVPFKFPAGRDLLNLIRAECASPGNKFGQDLVACGFEPKIQIEFAEALGYSGRLSVDAFLEGRPKFTELGKSAIARALVPEEIQVHLFVEEDNWYLNVWNLIADRGLEGIQQNRLSFLTFNYDRSLDQFLFSALQNSYGLSVGMSRALLKLSGSLVHDYATISDDSPSPNRASRARRAATSAGIS